MDRPSLFNALNDKLIEFYGYGGYGSYDDYDDDLEYKFVEKVTKKIQKVFPDAEVFEEPAGEAGLGIDYFNITINGTEYTYEFDIAEETDMLYSEGAAKTATYYANKIIEDLKDKIK